MHMAAANRTHLSVRETAAMLGVHPDTVRRRIADGSLAALQPGGPGTAVRVPAAALETPAHPEDDR
jgi:excisionase family DNA binding protein